MKRDMDLIREILLAIEAQPPGLMRQIPAPAEYERETILGHLRLIKDAGLLDGKVEFHRDTVLVAIYGLSNSGHDLLDSIRDEGVWRQTKEATEKVGGSVAIDVLKAIAGQVVSKMLGL